VQLHASKIISIVMESWGTDNSAPKSLRAYLVTPSTAKMHKNISFWHVYTKRNAKNFWGGDTLFLTRPFKYLPPLHPDPGYATVKNIFQV